jgi:hypothetical protein
LVILQEFSEKFMVFEEEINELKDGILELGE